MILRAVLLKFRNGTIAISGDIESMFHSFYLPVSHRNYVRFFWYESNDGEKPLCQMRARIHVFGNKPSSSCAIHGLRCIMDYEVEEDYFEDSKNFIKTQCYVDDAMAAHDDVNHVIGVMEGAKRKLSMFNFRLHKTASNNSQVRNAFPLIVS